MPDDDAEKALETIVKTVTGFGATNVSRGDYRILGHGKDKAIVLQPGAFTRQNIAPGIVNTAWVILVELYIAFRGEISTIASDLRTERQAVIDKIDAYPTLNKTVGIVLGALEAGDEPELWAVGSRQYWRQMLRVTVKEAGTVTYAE